MKKKTPSVVVLAVLTVITLITWIFYEVYQTLITYPPLEIPQEVIAPITPAFDSQGLDRLEKSVFFRDEEISTIILPPTTPSPTLLPTQSATPTPFEGGQTPTPTPTPTEGGG